jgi:predicted MPP superfamily phosphohydrolase
LLLDAGKSSENIAERLFLSCNTVTNYSESQKDFLNLFEIHYSIVQRAIKQHRYFLKSTTTQTVKTMLTRRQFLKSTIVGSAGIGIGLSLYDLQYEAYTADFVVEQLSIKVAGLPPAFTGYRIGFITDIHIGSWVPEAWYERALTTLSEIGVDILLLGGDYILVHETSLWDAAGLVRNPKFSGLPKAKAIPEIYSSFATYTKRFTCPDGILAVVGNHDHWNSFPDFLQVMRDFPEAKLLINEEHTIHRAEQALHIFGVDDYLTGLPAAPPTRPLEDGRAKRIILSHNPDYLPAILKRPEVEFSVALCGHTHGGQIVLPVLGPVAAQVVDTRFVSGMCHVGEKQVYTSRGLGVVGLPFRVNCPAEVTVFTLTPA